MGSIRRYITPWADALLWSYILFPLSPEENTFKLGCQYIYNSSFVRVNMTDCLLFEDNIVNVGFYPNIRKCCMCDGIYKIYLAANRKEQPMNGSLPYIRRHITINKLSFFSSIVSQLNPESVNFWIRYTTHPTPQCNYSIINILYMKAN